MNEFHNSKHEKYLIWAGAIASLVALYLYSHNRAQGQTAGGYVPISGAPGGTADLSHQVDDLTRQLHGLTDPNATSVEFKFGFDDSESGTTHYGYTDYYSENGSGGGGGTLNIPGVVSVGGSGQSSHGNTSLNQTIDDSTWSGKDVSQFDIVVSHGTQAYLNQVMAWLTPLAGTYAQRSAHHPT